MLGSLPGSASPKIDEQLVEGGKVVGSVVSTVKVSHLEGRSLLLVDHLAGCGQETGTYDIPVDTVQAGPGDTVLLLDEGNGARQILGLDPGAIRTVIVGVVDEVDLSE